MAMAAVVSGLDTSEEEGEPDGWARAVSDTNREEGRGRRRPRPTLLLGQRGEAGACGRSGTQEGSQARSLAWEMGQHGGKERQSDLAENGEGGERNSFSFFQFFQRNFKWILNLNQTKHHKNPNATS